MHPTDSFGQKDGPGIVDTFKAFTVPAWFAPGLQYSQIPTLTPVDQEVLVDISSAQENAASRIPSEGEPSARFSGNTLSDAQVSGRLAWVGDADVSESDEAGLTTEGDGSTLLSSLLDSLFDASRNESGRGPFNTVAADALADLSSDEGMATGSAPGFTAFAPLH
ncbi:hypothetical protein ACFQEX_24915, partial [Roseibium salinum]|uniref:hypothetical protein n=1 Tax=Roseibium salinum TaxID=1604349 RepID=UPI00361E5E43